MRNALYVLAHAATCALSMVITMLAIAFLWYEPAHALRMFAMTPAMFAAALVGFVCGHRLRITDTSDTGTRA